jgi:hypothetical protein
VLSAGFASVAGAAGVVAGSAAAGVVSVGAVSVLVGSVTAAAGVSSVFGFLSFFLKRPLKAFLSWFIASGAVKWHYVSLIALRRASGEGRRHSHLRAGLTRR